MEVVATMRMFDGEWQGRIVCLGQALSLCLSSVDYAWLATQMSEEEGTILARSPTAHNAAHAHAGPNPPGTTPPPIRVELGGTRHIHGGRILRRLDQ